MKVLMIGINYYPEITGIGKYSGEMAEWLAEQGVEVKVITAPPYYPEWKVRNKYKTIKYYRESCQGVSVIRCPIWVPSRPNGFKRILHLASFAISSFLPVIWAGIFWRPAVVIVIEPPFMCLPAGLVSAAFARATSWLHVQDFEIDAAFELGLIRSRYIRQFLASIERWLMRRFDVVSSISHMMTGHLRSKGVKEDRILLFPNWVDMDLVFPLSRPSVIRQELGFSDNQIVLLYSGNMGKKQGLEIIIEAARYLQDSSNFVFLMSGRGAVRAELEQLAEGLQNVSFMELQPIDRLNELLNCADIHLLPQRAGAEDLVMPSKLTAMMASGRPVIATARAGSEIARVLAGCGVIVEPGDLEGFLGAIQGLGRAVDERETMGRVARDYAMTHWGKKEILARAFSSAIKS